MSNEEFRSMKSYLWKHRSSWQQSTQLAPSPPYFDIRHSLFDIRHSDRAKDEAPLGHAFVSKATSSHLLCGNAICSFA